MHKYCKSAVRVFIFAVTCSFRQASPSSWERHHVTPVESESLIRLDVRRELLQQRSQRTPFLYVWGRYSTELHKCYHRNIHNITQEVSSTLFIIYQNSCIESSYPLYLRLPVSSSSSSPHMNHLPLSSCPTPSVGDRCSLRSPIHFFLQTSSGKQRSPIPRVGR